MTLLSCGGDPTPGSEAGIHHMVFLSLKDDLTASEIEKFGETLHEIGKIDGVLDMRVDERQDVRDARALDYDILLQVWLKDESALHKYDRDSLHNEIRSVLKDYLSAPPATFDVKLEYN